MLVDTHFHWPFSYSCNPRDLLEIMDYCKIDYAVISGFEVLIRKERASAWNDKLAQFCPKAGPRLIPMATVHLDEPDEAIDEAKRCIDQLGVKGFKIHPWLQGSTLSCEGMYRLCDLAAERNIPIMFHDGTPVYSLPSQVGLLAKRFPETVLILGHSGILHFWAEAIEVARQNRNIYVTLCGPHPWGLQRICDEADNDRILWGSDFIRPGNEELVKYRRDMLKCITLSKTQKAEITAGNAVRLYNLDIGEGQGQ